MAEPEPGVVQIDLRIAGIEPLGADVYRVQLAAGASGLPPFKAGQYLQILLPDVEPCAFSIASSPAHVREHQSLELHFGHQADNPASALVLAHLQREESLRARMPFGGCRIDVLPDRPVLLIAGSTGFAQIKSIIEQLLESGFAHDVHLYWGGRRAPDLYLDTLARGWADRHAHLTYHPVLSAAHEDDTPTEDMRDGWLHQAILEDFDDIGGFEVYASGSPGMVYSVYDSLRPFGATRARFHTDVFEYAPRPEDAT